MSCIIGIDFGTTNSAVAWMQDEGPVILPEPEGRALMPSRVSFDRDGISVGEAADSRVGTLVTGIKRLMGSDKPVQVGAETYRPPEISAMILGELKASAEARLGRCVSDAVITVPAYFNERQRRATREAAALAGLNPRRLVNEPTAAALAYGLDLEQAQKILVWDLGGGTFDASVLELDGGLYEVRAVNGDTCLGGADYDRRLTNVLAEAFRREHGLRLEQPAWNRVATQLAERAKVALTTRPETRIVLPAPLAGGRRPAVRLTREAFESATADITERMVAPVQQALADAGLDPIELDRVVLVGGMTRVPAVRRLVRDVTGLAPYLHLDPDKVVALGAAVQAGVLAGQVHHVALVDVTPLSLGIETEGGLFGRIIERNTPIPTSRSRLFTNARDNQRNMVFRVAQGERELAADNTALGTFHLEGLSSQPRGEGTVEVTFDIDANGMVQMSARDLYTEAALKVRLEAPVSLDQETARSMIQDGQKHRHQDQRRRRSAEIRIRARNLVAVADRLLTRADEMPTGQCAADALQADTRALREAIKAEDLDGIEAAAETLQSSLQRFQEALNGRPAQDDDSEPGRTGSAPPPGAGRVFQPATVEESNYDQEEDQQTGSGQNVCRF